MVTEIIKLESVGIYNNWWLKGYKYYKDDRRGGKAAEIHENYWWEERYEFCIHPAKEHQIEFDETEKTQEIFPREKIEMAKQSEPGQKK